MANDEKLALSDPQTNPSAIITRDWIAQKRKLIELISDDDVKNEYKSRFDDIESYFLPKKQMKLSVNYAIKI